MVMDSCIKKYEVDIIKRGYTHHKVQVLILLINVMDKAKPLQQNHC